MIHKNNSEAKKKQRQIARVRTIYFDNSEEAMTSPLSSEINKSYLKKSGAAATNFEWLRVVPFFDGIIF
jgi:hypothetical protein